MIQRPPSLDPSRGVRALEVAMIRLDTVQRQFGTDVPPEQLSLGLSNVSSMYQQALTIGRYNLPTNDAINGAFQQAMDGTVLLGRQLKAGSPPPAADVEALFGGWRKAATDGIAALQALTPAPATT